MNLSRSLLTFVVAGLASLGLFGCGSGNAAADLSAEEAVNIRFLNQSEQPIETLWLGRGTADTAATFTTRFVDIPAGALSEYLPVEPNGFNYRGASFTNGEQRWIARGFEPQELLGADALSTNTFYTFTIDTEGNDLVLVDVQVDEAS